MAKETYNQKNEVVGDLYWPANIVDTFDYLEIGILKYENRTMRSRTGNANNSQVQSTEGTPTPSSDATGSFFGVPSTTFTSTSSSTKEVGKVLLPIPDNISFTDGPQWSDQSVGTLGRFGAEAIKSAIAGGGTEGVTNAVTAMAEAGKVDVVKGLLSKIGVDPNALAQNVAGKIANPYMEQVFQGVGLRAFDFNWKLVPRNQKEQQSIQAILKLLRTSVLPNFSDDFTGPNDLADLLSPNPQELSGRPEVDRWLTVPSVFNLRWKYNGSEIDSLPKIKQCICKNISVQYTPDGVWATRMMNGKPQPIAYNLTMSFGEMEIVTGSDVQQNNY